MAYLLIILLNWQQFVLLNFQHDFILNICLLCSIVSKEENNKARCLYRIFAKLSQGNWLSALDSYLNDDVVILQARKQNKFHFPKY